MRNYEGNITIEYSTFVAFVKEIAKDESLGDITISGIKWLMKDDYNYFEITTLKGQKFFIDNQEFFKWIYKNFMPNEVDYFVYGQPIFYNGESKTSTISNANSIFTVHVNFAGSNECNPISWGEKPRWMEKQKIYHV